MTEQKEIEIAPHFSCFSEKWGFSTKLRLKQPPFAKACVPRKGHWEFAPTVRPQIVVDKPGQKTRLQTFRNSWE